MKLYKNRIIKFVTILLTIVITFNTILLSKYNKVEAVQTEEKIEMKEVGTFNKEIINGTIYYVQKFSIVIEEGTQYDININNFPEGTLILNTNNELITKIENDSFKIAILPDNISDELKGIINVNGTKYEFSKETNKSVIEVKVMFINKTVKPNATIELKKNDQLISSGISDENGQVNFSNLYPGRYSIYEKDINGNIIGELPIVLDLIYNEKRTITVINDILNGSDIIVENEKKKGSIEIHITDGDNEDIPIGNVEIEIYNSKNSLVETLTTNEEGISVSSKLAIDETYKVRQKSTWNDYIVDSNEYEVKFKENNEIIIIEIENFIKKNCIQIIKVDKDNNDIKLEGVIFGIYNENNELIEEITTDSNGNATSSELPINKQYYVREIKTLDNYVLDNNAITVFLTEKISATGKISINKLANTNNYLIIENQKIYNVLPRLGC